MKTHFSLVFLSVVLGVVGCGGGGSNNTEPPSPGPAPIAVGPTPTPTPTPVPTPGPDPEPVITLERVMPNPGITPSPTVALKWLALNAIFCEAMGGKGTSWTGLRVTSGNEVVSGVQTDTNYVFTLVCTGKGGVKSDSVSVMIPANPPPPPPPPIDASITCVAPGVAVSLLMNSKEFVSVTTECHIKAKSPVTFTELPVKVDGFSGKVSSVRMIEYVATMNGISCSYIPAPVARAPVLDGVATLPLADFRLGSECNTEAEFPFGKLVSFEVEFEKPIAPLGISEPVRDLRLSVTAGSNIKTVEPVAFLNSFPVQVGFGWMKRGEWLQAFGNVLSRVNLETGVSTPIWYVDNVYPMNVVPSPDGSMIAFTTSNGPRFAVMSLSGAGCTITDITTGPMSPECNKGYHAMPYRTYPSEGRLSISPDNRIVAFQDRSPSSTVFGGEDTDIWLSLTSQAGINQLTRDVYVDGSPQFSKDGTEVYFISCRPFDNPTAAYNPVPFVPYSGGCGIFKVGVNLVTGDPIGSVKYVVGNWSAFPYLPQFVLSPDNSKALVSVAQENGSYKVMLVNLDGTGSQDIGNGQNPKWISNDSISWHGERGFTIADFDGRNQRVLNGIAVQFVLP